MEILFSLGYNIEEKRRCAATDAAWSAARAAAKWKDIRMPFEIIRNDISKVAADAIVNTADRRPVVGPGVDLAIYTAAGYDRLLAEREKIGCIEPGCAAATPAFALDAKYVIHTVGPAWEGGNAGEEETVAACYRSSLKLAEELGCASIAFPLISTGTLGFPKDLALRAAIGAITDFLVGSDMDVILVVYDPESFVLSGKLFSGVKEYVGEKDLMLRSSPDDGQALYGMPAPPDDRELRTASDAQRNAYGSYSFESSRERGEELPKGRRRLFPSLFGRIGRKDRSGRPDEGGFAGLSEKAGSAPGPISASRIEPPEDFEPEAFEAPELERGEDPELLTAEDSALLTSRDSALLAARDSELPTAKEPLESAGTGFSGLMPSLSLDDRIKSRSETFQEHLFRMIDRKGYEDPEVYKAANISRKLFSKIRGDANYRPSKNTALALAIGLRLNADETRDLLLRAGYALSPASLSDIIIEYCIENGIYDIIEINCILFKYELPLLGG